MQDEKYSPGDLVEVLCDRTHSSDSLTTAFTCNDGGIKLYERIAIDSYPGYDEFKGATVDMMPGSVATVVRYIGRPNRIARSAEWHEYDVYEVLANGIRVQMFANNMRLLANRANEL